MTGATLEPDRDLGPRDGAVFVFGGPVSNLEATRAALAAAEQHGIPPERTVCTGDVVAYCADPQATVDAIREAGVHTVMGNCEESLGERADDCGCNFAAGSACDALSGAWYAHANRHLTDDARAWMRDLPRVLRFRVGRVRVAAVHGSPAQINGWVFASTDAAEKHAALRALGVDAIVAGHAGIPFVHDLGDGLWVNAGSVGMPANDGTPRGWSALLIPDGDGVRVELHALSYDHAGAAARMRAERLPEAYASALETGRWPSEDVLPAAERAQAGVALPATRTLRWAPIAAAAR
ncbi:Calcineurin-like phosphoesterase superfamily domain-containing protein [Limimonas halophila]|uniref:Calcineurin-like phosphoesterase superfamily domain-containing protein n=1 Tax=Limimonas halophila TaxID=1082479 RepID=A0A1G7RBF5_9PROT|nr:metallophosphoesterase family protein [Limimonas halophila]SDG08108.1 Calcineurin-like phosphoesterase superfamily domain-containing protein [Limimonas halophila]